jgi:hypothetical protein
MICAGWRYKGLTLSVLLCTQKHHKVVLDHKATPLDAPQFVATTGSVCECDAAASYLQECPSPLELHRLRERHANAPAHARLFASGQSRLIVRHRYSVPRTKPGSSRSSDEVQPCSLQLIPMAQTFMSPQGVLVLTPRSTNTVSTCTRTTTFAVIVEERDYALISASRAVRQQRK